LQFTYININQHLPASGRLPGPYNFCHEVVIARLHSKEGTGRRPVQRDIGYHTAGLSVCLVVRTWNILKILTVL